MTDASDMSINLDRAPVIPIYEAMLERALQCIEAGSMLDAADMLTTAAETMLQFEHPEAMRVASWAWNLLENPHLTDDPGEADF